jgi:hypothetical protein
VQAPFLALPHDLHSVVTISGFDLCSCLTVHISSRMQPESVQIVLSLFAIARSFAFGPLRSVASSFLGPASRINTEPQHNKSCSFAVFPHLQSPHQLENSQIRPSDGAEVVVVIH